MLKLDDCLGERKDVGWLETISLSGEAMITQDLMLIGYHGDKDLTTPYADPYCRVSEAADIGIKHDCSSRSGASGSPLLAVKRNGTPVVVGINTGPRVLVEEVTVYNDISANWGVSMREILATPGVKDLLERDKARIAGGNPNRMKRPLIAKPINKA